MKNLHRFPAELFNQHRTALSWLDKHVVQYLIFDIIDM